MRVRYALPHNKMFDYARELMQRLQGAGFQSYLVGGCVRDLLILRSVHDIDITTDATPNELLRIFPDAKKTGLAHGTVTVCRDQYYYEITTFRTDGSYLDGRHPDFVHFETDLIKDLSRRDFTVNAMALDAEGVLYDPHSGRIDLEQKLIRAVGNPYLRFTEDGLRVARAFRFAAMLNFTLAEETANALLQCATNLAHISVERRRDEWTKWLLSTTDDICKAFPEIVLKNWLNMDINKNVLMCESYRFITGYLDRLALLLLASREIQSSHDASNKNIFLQTMRYSRKEISEINDLLTIATASHVAPPVYLPLEWLPIYRRRGKSGLIRGILLANVSRISHLDSQITRADLFQQSENMVTDMLTQSPLHSLRDLDISGNELATVCQLKNQEIGSALAILYHGVSKQLVMNQSSDLIAYIRAWKRSRG